MSKVTGEPTKTQILVSDQINLLEAQLPPEEESLMMEQLLKKKILVDIHQQFFHQDQQNDDALRVEPDEYVENDGNQKTIIPLYQVKKQNEEIQNIKSKSFLILFNIGLSLLFPLWPKLLELAKQFMIKKLKNFFELFLKGIRIYQQTFWGEQYQQQIDHTLFYFMGFQISISVWVSVAYLVTWRNDTTIGVYHLTVFALINLVMAFIITLLRFQGYVTQLGSERLNKESRLSSLMTRFGINKDTFFFEFATEVGDPFFSYYLENPKTNKQVFHNQYIKSATDEALVGQYTKRWISMETFVEKVLMLGYHESINLLVDDEIMTDLTKSPSQYVGNVINASKYRDQIISHLKGEIPYEFEVSYLGKHYDERIAKVRGKRVQGAWDFDGLDQDQLIKAILYLSIIMKIILVFLYYWDTIENARPLELIQIEAIFFSLFICEIARKAFMTVQVSRVKLLSAQQRLTNMITWKMSKNFTVQKDFPTINMFCKSSWLSWYDARRLIQPLNENEIDYQDKFWTLMGFYMCSLFLFFIFDYNGTLWSQGKFLSSRGLLLIIMIELIVVPIYGALSMLTSCRINKLLEVQIQSMREFKLFLHTLGYHVRLDKQMFLLPKSKEHWDGMDEYRLRLIYGLNQIKRELNILRQISKTDYSGVQDSKILNSTIRTKLEDQPTQFYIDDLSACLDSILNHTALDIQLMQKFLGFVPLTYQNFNALILSAIPALISVIWLQFQK